MVALGQELSEQGGVVILTDPDGIVLGRQGDHAFSVEADRLGLSEGIDWSEQAIGTNAIGTTALERTALTIVGAEHLFCLNTSISCSAVPILDPCGALAGVLDVSTSLTVRTITCSFCSSAPFSKLSDGCLNSASLAT